MTPPPPGGRQREVDGGRRGKRRAAMEVYHGATLNSDGDADVSWATIKLPLRPCKCPEFDDLRASRSGLHT